MTQSTSQYMVRFPDGLRDIIKQKAKENMRSMNAEIILHLENVYRPKEPASEK